mmetsp:Transcript_3695/g.5324  ORF Transcript_3695/g.5324 Transcript_3695/m.5324 type:complete len:839 (-) Transcript_3695:497-3013(-)
MTSAGGDCPLLLVEVIALASTIDGHINTSSTDDLLSSSHKRYPLSAPLAKLQLLNLCRQRNFSRGWLRKEECVGQSYRGLWLKAHTFCNQDIIIPGDVMFRGKDNNSQNLLEFNDNTILQTYLKSDDPLKEKIPCLIRGYILSTNNCRRSTYRQGNTAYFRCVVTDETLVRVQHLSDVKDIISSKMEGNKRQKDCLDLQHSISSYRKLSSYDPETVQSLALRMSTILTNAVWIGADSRALDSRKEAQKNLISMQNELNSFWDTQQCTDRTVSPSLLREGALLVYNEHSGSGKSFLVKTIATDVLHCHAVHVISAASLLAKYGTSADAALESTLHELALKGAIKGCASVDSSKSAKICIILDHFESFLSSSATDPYSPILNAIASFLNRLSYSLRDKKEFPYPSLNTLYNIRCGGGYSGLTLPLQFCLVGVITNSNDKIFHNALDALGGGRFYVPLPSTKTRCTAFEHAFDCVGVRLDNEARESLPKLAASATWANGGAFLDIAKRLSSEDETSKRDLERAMSSRNVAPNSSTDDQSAVSFPNLEDTASTLSSVGGNFDAKLALEDALALDANKRSLLASFGLRPPTGVLLYGPPGTGKTLLAKAVAISLRSHSNNKSERDNSGSLSFISLKASDIVRPEVGNSEKLIVSAFAVARSNAPSVVFIDEFQALFGDRGGSSVVLGQLASTLLQCMDDVAKWSFDDTSNNTRSPNGRIVVLAATNTPWMVDTAFLRPGRFDRAVHVGLPNVADREDILRVHTKRMKIASSEDDICKSLAKLCIGFSGADLASLCKAAAVRCLHGGEKKKGVSKQHFLDAYENDVVRSSNDALVKRISLWSVS